MRPLFEVGEDVILQSRRRTGEFVITGLDNVVRGDCDACLTLRQRYWLNQPPQEYGVCECALRKRQDGSGATDVEGILNRLDIEVEA